MGKSVSKAIRPGWVPVLPALRITVCTVADGRQRSILSRQCMKARMRIIQSKPSHAHPIPLITHNPLYPIDFLVHQLGGRVPPMGMGYEGFNCTPTVLTASQQHREALLFNSVHGLCHRIQIRYMTPKTKQHSISSLKACI